MSRANEKSATSPLPGLAARYGDLVLAIFVVGVVAMMILPLPTWMLDLLLTLNIGVSVTLLMMAVYVPDALRFSSFPTMLLVTTLFRLGLNVSSTRLILSQADAGEVIRAFGHFVTQGNLVVGGVVFLILTLIQFIVIAKGAERVAEVAARFTLDAMPGKQMSIDADLRAGAFDLDEARRRRGTLQRESQLYGAMDGAMKFVKGDAIAGLVIIAVNILGGLTVGVMQNGMPAGEALDIYTLLTIGDGLVSQIPALIVSVAAGMIVTRVASEDEGSHLGKDIGGQILQQPKAIAVTSGLLIVMGVVPGMPFVPFLLLGGAGALVAIGLLRAERERASAALPARAGPRDGGPLTAGVPPIEVFLSPELLANLGGERGLFANEAAAKVRVAVFEALGVDTPPFRLRPAAAGGEAGAYCVFVTGVPAARGVVEFHTPAQGAKTTIDTTVSPEASAALIAELERVVRTQARSFIGIQETQRLLDALEKQAPTLVREVVPKLMSLQLLTDVLRRLVEEDVSIRDLRGILGALADWARSEKDPVLLTEHVRAALRRQLTYSLAGEAETLSIFLLDSLIEDTIRNAIQRLPSGSYLALDPETSQDIVAAIRREVDARPDPTAPAVVLTSLEIRRFVKRLCEVDIPDLAVVSYQELTPNLQLQPLGRIGVG